MIAVTIAILHGDRHAWQLVREDICHRPLSGVTPLVRAKALPERMEAPAGLRAGYPCHMLEGPGLIHPVGLACPQPGLQPARGYPKRRPPARAVDYLFKDH